MSDHHQLHVQPAGGEIVHVNNLSEDIASLFQQEVFCDVNLVVEDSSFPAHKIILAARSDYFRALLFGGLSESDPKCDKIELKDTNAAAFYILLKYIYSGRIELMSLKEELILDVLELAHRYGFEDLENSISDYLQSVLNISNVCLIYNMASAYGLSGLRQTSCEYMDLHASEIIVSESFLSLNKSAIKEVLSRDSFCAPEIQIFHAIKIWLSNNKETSINEVISVVRFPLLCLNDLLHTVRNSGIVSAESILDAIEQQHRSSDMELRYRGVLTPDENIATLRYGATVILGEMKTALLDGDVTCYDLDRGFTRHPIDDTNVGIVILLSMPSIINTIRLLLWDRDSRSYSYVIEISMDDKDWVRIIDYSQYLCQSWQTLYFEPCVARYIRILGTHNTVNRVFHLVHFECLYSRKTLKTRNGVVIPTENVATVPASAGVIEGVSRSRNALINGDIKNYDWDSGYTCHQLGSGAIVVQLAQPYIISQMRLLLWDVDGRAYSYFIEVSNNQTQWTTVIDKTNEQCRSWQLITFEPIPVTFIRIVGTHNTANEVFHCVHFECPLDPKLIVECNVLNSSSTEGAEAEIPNSYEVSRRPANTLQGIVLSSNSSHASD